MEEKGRGVSCFTDFLPSAYLKIENIFYWRGSMLSGSKFLQLLVAQWFSSSLTLAYLPVSIYKIGTFLPPCKITCASEETQGIVWMLLRTLKNLSWPLGIKGGGSHTVLPRIGLFVIWRRVRLDYQPLFGEERSSDPRKRWKSSLAKSGQCGLRSNFTGSPPATHMGCISMGMRTF